MILLDTNTLIRFAAGMSDLGASARRRVSDGLIGGGLALSSVSLWEIALKHSKKKLHLPRSPADFWDHALSLGFAEIPLDGRIALESVALSAFGADPADRFIVATARLHGAELMTSDERILSWPGALARIDARL